MTVRGKIYNPEWASQLRDFSGMLFRDISGRLTITPTDIDGLVEYQKKAFMYQEAKFSITPLPHPRFEKGIPFGQCLALERAVADHKSPTVLYVARHNVPADIPIPMSEIVVDWYYSNIGRNKLNWQAGDGKTLKENCDHFIEIIDQYK